jgi:uncharacterized protein (TIGR02001 family)
MIDAFRSGLFSLTFVGLAVAAPSALAADAPPTVVALPDVAPAEEPAASPWVLDMSFNMSLTSDYMFRGITNSDHEPAGQATLESTYGIFYGGLFVSNVDFRTPDPDVEVDLSGGLRPTFGPVSTDIGYVRYFYPDASDIEYGEAYGIASVSPTEMLSLGGSVYYSPDYGGSGDDSLYVEGNATVSLPHDISLSGAFGSQMFDSGVGLSDYLTWNVGASYTWKALTFDLRYHDTDLSSGTCGAEYPSSDSCDARIVATLSFDTTWSALRDSLKGSAEK